MLSLSDANPVAKTDAVPSGAIAVIWPVSPRVDGGTAPS